MNNEWRGPRAEGDSLQAWWERWRSSRARRRPMPRDPQLATRDSSLANWIERILLVALVALLSACGDPGTGPVDIKWDRTTCERCRMVLSDRHHSAQVRVPVPGGGSKIYAFDDLGCAVIWLDGQPTRDDPATEIWVNDWRTGDWIDARSAHYVPDQSTPMAYGLGAQPEPGPGTLDYAQAREQIYEVERKFNVHGGHLDAAPPTPQPGQ